MLLLLPLSQKTEGGLQLLLLVLPSRAGWSRLVPAAAAAAAASAATAHAAVVPASPAAAEHAAAAEHTAAVAAAALAAALVTAHAAAETAQHAAAAAGVAAAAGWLCHSCFCGTISSTPSAFPVSSDWVFSSASSARPLLQLLL